MCECYGRNKDVNLCEWQRAQRRGTEPNLGGQRQHSIWKWYQSGIWKVAKGWGRVAGEGSGNRIPNRENSPACAEARHQYRVADVLRNWGWMWLSGEWKEWIGKRRGQRQAGDISDSFGKKNQGVELYPNSHRGLGNAKVRSVLWKDHSAVP